MGKLKKLALSLFGFKSNEAEIPELKRELTFPKLKQQRLVINPLLQWPRNRLCMCGGKKKFKHCHQAQIPTMVSRELAAEAYRVLKAAGLK